MVRLVFLHNHATAFESPNKFRNPFPDHFVNLIVLALALLLLLGSRVLVVVALLIVTLWFAVLLLRVVRLGLFLVVASGRIGV